MQPTQAEWDAAASIAVVRQAPLLLLRGPLLQRPPRGCTAGCGTARLLADCNRQAK